MPLPREEATPPVTKMCLVNGGPPCADRSTQPRESTLPPPRHGRRARRAAAPRDRLGSLRAAMATASTARSRPAAPARPRSSWRPARSSSGSRPTCAERHLTFDDGVYGASAVAMRAGRPAVPRRVLEPGPALPARSSGWPTWSASARSTPRASSPWPPASCSWSPPTWPAGASPTAPGALLAAGLVTGSRQRPLGDRARWPPTAWPSPSPALTMLPAAPVARRPHRAAAPSGSGSASAPPSR